jgi:cytosine/uracil/thiamine/allantoin permease
MFVPVLGIVMTDYFLIRKRTMELDELDRPEGPYWYFKGVNRAAILAWIAGFGVFQGLAALHSPLGSSLPSILAAGIVYYLCMFRRTHAQG